MSSADRIEVLRCSVRQAERLAGWVERSHGATADVDPALPLAAEQMDAFEALSGRFARLCDLLMKRVFRSLDAVEMEDEGTLLDVLNRAERRGIIPSAAWFREVRELRNIIAHEYADDDLPPIFRAIRERVPGLLDTVQRTADYAARYFPEST